MAATTGADNVGLVTTPVKVPSGKIAGPIKVIVFASGDEILKQTTTEAKIADLSGNADGITAAFSNVKLASVAKTTSNNALTTSRLEWSADLAIAGNVPPGKTIARDAQLAVGDAMRRFSYEISSKSTPLTWTLNAPVNAVSLTGENATLRFSVSATGEGETTTARITRSTIRDANNRVAPISALSLADSRVTIGAPSTLDLKIDGSNIPPGSYTGNLELSLDGAAEAKPFDLAIASSSRWARIIGFFCVFAGIVIATLLIGMLRNYAAYLGALLPASRMTDTLVRERDRLVKAVGEGVAIETEGWIAELIAKLRSKELRAQGYLPGRIPAAFGVAGVDAQGYTAYLKSQGDEVAKVAYLIESGFLLVTKFTKVSADVTAAYAALDKLAIKPRSDVETKTDDIIKGLQAPPKAPIDLSGESAATISTEQILLRTDFVNGVAWLLFAVIATVVGYLAAVNVNGFGVTADFIKAFLWGLGLQTAGTALQAMTPSSVATGIGITIPKVTP